jgi:mitosis inhibitor protein kinase SWE1
MITFEGILKIGDFGMAAKWPAKSGIEGEGDREYIGPEILMGKYDKPADIFALGLIMLETAGNVELPDNGVSWQKLRNGDMSDVPSLTWSSEQSSVVRDATGNPVSQPNLKEVDADVMDSDDHEQTPTGPRKSPTLLARNGELTVPPDFMVDATNALALDQVVRWMISPEPTDRPLATDILITGGVRFVQSRRRAGATVYEGNWGPADSVLAEDAEMLDV